MSGEEENNQAAKNSEQNWTATPISSDGASGDDSTRYKIAIVGMNELGSTTAFLLISRQIATHLVLIDRDAKRLAGADDLSACTAFVSGVHVHSSDQLAACEGARIIIMCDLLDDESADLRKNQPFKDNERVTGRAQQLFKAIGPYGTNVSNRR